MKEPNVFGLMDNFANIVNLEQSLERGKGKKVKLSNVIRKERMWMTKKYVARWAYKSTIPFYAFEKDSFKILLEVVGQFRHGLPPPTRYELSTPLLKEEIVEYDGDGNKNRDEEVEVQDQQDEEVQWEVIGEAMEADEYLQPRQIFRTTTKTTQRELFYEEFESGSEEVVYKEGDYEPNGVKIIEDCGDED
nr:hypothetical protein [Tanacetum cinerariifolium]GEZ32887.1 hypothetical protein [Tanacetum cinerariifolium]